MAALVEIDLEQVAKVMKEKFGYIHDGTFDGYSSALLDALEDVCKLETKITAELES